MVDFDDLPIIGGLAVVAVLLFSASRAPRIPPAWFITAFVVCLLMLPLPDLFARVSATQYNLAELFRQDIWLPAARLALLVMWAPLTARWAADQWRYRAPIKTIAWGCGSCLVAWGLLRRAVTVESIHDILGAPVLGLPMDAEYILRFGCVYFALYWLPVFFAVLALSSRRGLLTWTAFALSLTISMPTIIQSYSPSDNVRELFPAGGGYWFAALCLSCTWVAALCSRVGFPGALGLAGLAVVPAWLFFSNSLDVPAVHGLRISLPWFGFVFVALIACMAPAISDLKLTVHPEPRALARAVPRIHAAHSIASPRNLSHTAPQAATSKRKAL